MADTIWSKISGDSDDGVETEVKNLVAGCRLDGESQYAVMENCCDGPDLWFQRLDVTPVTDYFRVVCRACGRQGDETDWSWPRAVALWNVPLWNPKYMGRDPLKLADRIEELQLNGEVKLKDVAALLDALKEAPRWLRRLVDECEEEKVGQYMRKVDCE